MLGDGVGVLPAGVAGVSVGMAGELDGVVVGLVPEVVPAGAVLLG